MAHNPWLEIPLADYEAHMALPQVAQAALLCDVLADLLRAHRPASVALLGCAGGNGCELIDPAVTRRVVAVDLNPAYVNTSRARFADRFACFETICGDVEQDLRCEPVALAYAALLFEYVEVAPALRTVAAMLAPDGVLAVVLQEPSPDVAAVTPSPYVSLGALAARLRHVDPDALADAAEDVGLAETSCRRELSAGGKNFVVKTFQHGSRP